MTKVDEAASYGKLTVNALERLEHRFETTSMPDFGAKATSDNLSDIASSLSRMESMLCGGYSPTPPTGSCSGQGFHFSRGDSPSSMGPPTESPTHVGRRPSSPLPPRPAILSDDRSVVGFLGHGPILTRRRFICSCCYINATFDSAEELKLVLLIPVTNRS